MESTGLNEILINVFKQLELLDLLKCRLVCRDWKNLVSKVMIEELVLDCGQIKLDEPIIFSKFINRTKWFKIRTPYKNVIKTKNNSSLDTLSSMFDLINLKRLRINSPIDYNAFEIGNLNKFTNLEQLEIGYYNRQSSAQLYLPNLKTFYFRSNSIGSLQVNSNTLEILSCTDLNQIKLKQPETIKYLEIDHFKENDLADFKNVEYLQIYSVNEPTKENILNSFPNLKRIRILPNYDQEFDYYKNIGDFVKQLLIEKEYSRTNFPEIILESKLIFDYEETIDFYNEDNNSYELLFVEDFCYPLPYDF